MARARKDYTCGLCGLLIPKDSEYERKPIYPDSIYNDRFGVSRAHKPCLETWARIGPELDWEYPGVDEFRELLTTVAV